MYLSVLDVPLALLLDSRPQRRTLATLQDRGLVTWGELTRHATGRPRQWLPPYIITQLLTFAAAPPGDCPTDEHPSLQAGQFWMLRGTANERGGLFRVTTAPTPTTPFVTLQRWLGIEQRTWRPSPTIGQRVRPAGRTTHLCSADFAARSHRRVIVHLPAPHKVGTILTHFMDTYQVQSPLAHTGRTLSAPSWTPPGPAGHKTCGEISWRTSSPATDPTSPLPLDFPQLTIPQILSPGQAPLLDGLRPALAYASLLPCISLQLPSSHGTRRPCQGPSPTGEPTPARPRTLTGTGDPPPVIPPP